MRITVNGKSVYVTHARLSFKEVVFLAEMHTHPPGELVVTYDKGLLPPRGVMVPGDIVKAQPITIFSVSRKP